MKKLSSVALIIAVVLCVVVSIFRWKDKETASRLATLNLRLDSELFTARETEHISAEIYRRTVRYSQTPLENAIVYWGGDTLQTQLLSEIAKKTRLVFCFSINSCSPCIDTAIKLLKEQFSDFESNESILITGDNPMRLRDDCYGKRMLGGITLPLNEIEAPFFFILNEDVDLSHLHILNKMDTNSTVIYLTEIKKKFINYAN
ncbi:hypothetical protein FACS189426_01100 [Bacteroidia bacterium]|nr:hypothetical protein FACS189426_01100 [Bacteroidia bacterium]